MGGLCGVGHKQTDAEVVNRTRRHNTGNISESNNNKVQEEKKEKFIDFEEYKNGKLIGEGIKQIPSYKCSLPYDKLNDLRNEFWNSKRNSRIWLVLKTCCETDARKNLNLKLVSAKELLSAEELQIIGNNMRTVISIINPDYIYNVPNFCICDPIYEKDFTMFESNEDKIKEKFLTITITYVFNNTQHKFEVSNKTYGKELKALYADAANKPLNKYKLRLLLKGQEIKDEHPLFFYGIEEDNRIQVSIAEL